MPTIEKNQISDTAIVIRLRFRSATPELPRLDVIPPPNMSERPPPRPLWSRINTVKSRLVITSNTVRMICRTTKGEPFKLSLARRCLGDTRHTRSSIANSTRFGCPSHSGGHRFGALPHRGRASLTAASLRGDVLRELDDPAELFDLQTRPTNQSAVNVSLLHEARDVVAFHAAAVQNACLLGDLVTA